ncbi:antiviral innate immune response receptor RIG-I-like isoform X2 [Liolophura sinensis]|uniref:antiviral innate immune response receptor RIG-I-like isoform X2 n=1 Tax=Liolophura sinensis TaxID=3198878 RepID=UPI00315973A8
MGNGNSLDIGHGRSNLAAPSTFSKDVMHGSLMTSFDLKAGIKAPVDQGETVCDGPSNRFKDLAQLEEDGFKQRKPIKLRGYQEELAEAGLEGKNCMIVAPTGSGKTHVALKIIEEHLSASHENRKVAILVKDVVLAEQHTESCKAHLPRELRTKLITGGNDEQISLSRLLQDFDVFVMTVQILADALAFDEFYILSEFTMIVFDECHHTLRKHPYNVVMSSYLDEKLREGGPRRPLPQIIGLTASTGVGKAKDILQAKEHIKKLCANLDVEKICTVKRGLRELSKVVNIPDVEIHLVGGRLEDHFAAFVQKWMIDIESKIKNHCRYWTKIEDPPPGRRDCLEYKQWISRIIETVVRRPDSQLYCMSCIRFAEICNDALIINQNVRTRDALNYMSNQIHEMDVSRFTDIEKELFAIFQENLDYLNEVCGRPASANPKLEKMKKLILWVFNEDPDSRVIIFAKFRKLAQALVGWMTETDSLSSLNAQKLVGQGAEEDGGMSQAKQGDVRKGFREGSHKVIVATSVAEEGLDIQKCNMVILYDYDTNEISKVQTRGRARAEDSRYVLLVSEGKGVAEKDELNTMREVLMENAVWDLQEEIEENPRGFVDVTRGIQINCKKERDLKRLMEQNRQFIKGTFQLRCKKCNTLACYNYDIRQFESTHRAVISEDFCDRADISLHPKPTKFTIAKKGKVWCAKCGYDWGIVACYRSKNLFVIKIVAFVVVDYEGRRSTFKKWTAVRFEIDNFQQGDRDSCDRVSERIATRLADCELKGE